MNHIKLVLVLLLVLAARAHAEPDTTYHLDGGVEFEGGHSVSSAAFRGHALIGKSFGDGGVRPQVAVGGTFGAGSLYVDDPRAVDGAVGVNFASYGPEVQLGLQFYREHDATWRLFASLAYMRVDLDSRLMIDPLPGVGGNHGKRASLGLNAVRAEALAASESSCSRHDCDTSWLMILLPEQVEATVEDDAGSRRYGIALSWGS
ncbi:MAG: hypothetical protein ACM31C_12125 [Acidobacteriota bacterium]